MDYLLTTQLNLQTASPKSVSKEVVPAAWTDSETGAEGALLNIHRKCPGISGDCYWKWHLINPPAEESSQEH